MSASTYPTENDSQPSQWGSEEVRYKSPREVEMERKRKKIEELRKMKPPKKKQKADTETTTTISPETQTNDDELLNSNDQDDERKDDESFTTEDSKEGRSSLPKVQGFWKKFSRQYEAFEYYDDICRAFWNRCRDRAREGYPVPGLYLPSQEAVDLKDPEYIQQLLRQIRLPLPPYKVMSEELNTEGKRNFIVGTFDEIFKLFKSLSHPNHRYEILREDCPVHLYFDIEFPIDRKTGLNTELDGNELLQKFIERLREHMRGLFGTNFSKANVVDLESSSITKFSRHLIIRLPSGFMFRDHQHAGEFLLTLIADMFEDETSHDYWIPDREGEKWFLADVAVYTRNRAMRTYLSCKMGKTQQLLPAKENSFNPMKEEKPQRKLIDMVTGLPLPSESKEDHNDVLELQTGSSAWEKQMWLSSLITDFIPPLNLILRYIESVYGLKNKDSLPSDNIEGSNPRLVTRELETFHPTYHPCCGRLLYMYEPTADFVDKDICVAKWSPPEKVKPCFEHSSRIARTGIAGRYRRLVKGEYQQPNDQESQEYKEIWAYPCGGDNTASKQDTILKTSCTYVGTVVGYSMDKFPFPQLADYIARLASKGGKAATIRKWEGCLVRAKFVSIGKQSDNDAVRKEVYVKFIFHIGGNRWCERIGRFHKSNHVAYLVDLTKGTSHQVCFDPDCSGFRGRNHILPSTCLPNQCPESMTLDTTSKPQLEKKSVMSEDPAEMSDELLWQLDVP